MKISRAGIWILGPALALCVQMAPAQAQATRTWVSGVGDDANPCSRTAPCKTFAGAISKTAAAGEIDVLDPGGFGAVTITKSISIYNDGVGEAGVLVSGTNGIIVNAGVGDVVNLRGLVFDGVNLSGSSSGVNFIAGAELNISNCVIQEMGTGVTFGPTTANATMHIQDTMIVNNPTGILIKPTGGFTAKVSLDRVRIVGGSGGGLKSDGTGGTGAINVSITDSLIAENASNGINAVGGTGANNVALMRTSVSNNGGTGLQANGATATVSVGESLLLLNGTATNSVSSGVIASYKTNEVIGPLGSGFTSMPALQ
jgi:hypothetical protein